MAQLCLAVGRAIRDMQVTYAKILWQEARVSIGLDHKSLPWIPVFWSLHSVRQGLSGSNVPGNCCKPASTSNQETSWLMSQVSQAKTSRQGQDVPENITSLRTGDFGLADSETLPQKVLHSGSSRRLGAWSNNLEREESGTRCKGRERNSFRDGPGAHNVSIHIDAAAYLQFL